MGLLKRPLLFAFLLLIFFSVYWYGAYQQLTLVNTNKAAADQLAYLNYARRLVETGYSYQGGGNRMPLYPFLQSLFYDAHLDDRAALIRGTYVNLGLSLLQLIGIFLIVRRRLKWHLTLNFMLITAFTVFMFKAPYFQAELLFYFLSFVFFLLMLRLFREPSTAVAALTGIIIGLTYLTKASVTPGLLLFVVFIGLKGLFRFIQRRRSMSFRKALVMTRPLLLVGPVVAICFLITIYVQIRNNKEKFGHYFYNVNTTFYVWYDSWEEVNQGTKAHGDRLGWPEMPTEEIPSLRKYVREHTVTQMVNRFLTGTIAVVWDMSLSYGYFKYVAFYLLLLFHVAYWVRPQTKRLLRASPFTILFVLAYFSVYLLLYGWYARIALGNRFVLALFLPLLYVLFRGLQAYRIRRFLTIKGYKLDWLTVVNLLVLAILTVDITFIMTGRIATMYGGT